MSRFWKTIYLQDLDSPFEMSYVLKFPYPRPVSIVPALHVFRLKIFESLILSRFELDLCHDTYCLERFESGLDPEGLTWELLLALSAEVSRFSGLDSSLLFSTVKQDTTSPFSCKTTITFLHVSFHSYNEIFMLKCSIQNEPDYVSGPLGFVILRMHHQRCWYIWIPLLC